MRKPIPSAQPKGTLITIMIQILEEIQHQFMNSTYVMFSKNVQLYWQFKITLGHEEMQTEKINCRSGGNESW